jgi:glucan endo-1,3-alpha-glucosidase
MSSLQYKHLAKFGNWYRAGGSNFHLRMHQILDLQPDFVEVLTWNDGGESHYIGNLWPSASTKDADYSVYTNDYDHTGKRIELFLLYFLRGRSCAYIFCFA